MESRDWEDLLAPEPKDGAQRFSLPSFDPTFTEQIKEGQLQFVSLAGQLRHCFREDNLLQEGLPTSAWNKRILGIYTTLGSTVRKERRELSVSLHLLVIPNTPVKTHKDSKLQHSAEQMPGNKELLGTAGDSKPDQVSQLQTMS